MGRSTGGNVRAKPKAKPKGVDGRLGNSIKSALNGTHEAQKKKRRKTKKREKGKGLLQIERLSQAQPHFTFLALDQSGAREEQTLNEQGTPLPFPRTSGDTFAPAYVSFQVNKVRRETNFG